MAVKTPSSFAVAMLLFFLRRPQHPSNSADVTTMATLTVFFNNFQKMPDDSMPDFANATISN